MPCISSWRTVGRGLLLLNLALTSASCAKFDAEPQAASVAVEKASEPPKTRSKQQGEDTTTKAPRKLVRTAELHIETGSYAQAKRAIDQKLEAAKGFIANATVEHHQGSVSSAVLTLKIPADKLDHFISDCSKLGTVTHESSHTEDISEQYYDTKARLDNARKLETRLLELVSVNTHNVKDLLEVERELGRVRGEIETLEGKQRLFDHQVAMSTLTLKITTRERFSAGEPLTLWDEIRTTFADSASALLSTGRGLSLLIVALLPWLPLLALLFFSGQRLIRFRRRRAVKRLAAEARAKAEG